MSKIIAISILLFFLLLLHPLMAYEGTVFECHHVSGEVHCLYGEGGNIGVLVTEDGVLVVDSQFESVADTILSIIKTLSDQKLKYLINTHYHADHTGGDDVIGKNAKVIMHPNCKASKVKLLRQGGINSAFFNLATEWTEGMILKLGGETVRLLHFGSCHTSGDLIVVFETSKVIHTGDLFFHGWPPYIDVWDGSDTENWIRTIRAIGKKYPDYRYIPGHGEVTDARSFLMFADYLAYLRMGVQEAIKAGKSREETMVTINTDIYRNLKDPRPGGMLTVQKNIGWIYDEMTRKRE